MSSSRTRSSSGVQGEGSAPPKDRLGGNGPSTSALPPITPRKRFKRKSVAPLTTKQYDKMAKQILQIQKATQRQGVTPHDEAEEGDASSRASDLLNTMSLKDSNADTAQPLGASSPDTYDHGKLETQQVKRGLDPDVVQSEAEIAVTEQWLHKTRAGSRTAYELVRARGEGSRAKPFPQMAVGGLRGTQAAPSDSFAHEGSFILNPLGRRVPQQASQGVKVTDAKGRERPGSPVWLASQGARENKAGARLDTDTETAGSPSVTSLWALGDLPREVQEAAAIEDLLCVLMGMEGQIISFAPDYRPDDMAARLRGVTFAVHDSLDSTLRDLVLRILPLASCYSAITTFIDLESALQSGTIMHALCAALRDIIEDYQDLIVKLEHQFLTSPNFTLQQMWLYLHPMLQSLSLIYALISDISAISHADAFDSDSEEEADSDDDDSGQDNSDSADEDLHKARQEMELEKRRMFHVAGVGDGDGDAHELGVEGGIVKGGEILSMLWDRIERQSGDLRAHKLFLDLFHKSSQPYARTLVRWISTGILSDSFEEFMVMEDHKVTYDSLKTDPSDIYWEQRYTLRDQNILAERERERQGFSDEEAARRDEEERLLIESGRGLFTGGASIPAFLQPWKQKILLAGKYLNVVRECGVSIDTTADETQAQEPLDLRRGYVMTDATFFRGIDEAYQRANSQLLRLLVQDFSLVERLRSLKHYLLFSSSDFFASFFEQAERELRKLVNPMHVRDSIRTRLQTHLGMVLGSSAVVGFSDPYKDDIKVGTSLDNPYESLKRIANTRGVTGGADAAEALALKAKMKAREKDYTALLLDVLEFDVTVKFPVSLVISRKNMIRWKFLHTILIQLKVAERQLSDVWLEQQAKHWQSRIAGHSELEGWKMRVFKLRHRMTSFTQNVLAFFTSEVIEPNWSQLEKKMSSAKTVDQFLRDHTDFLNECRKECMLTDVRFVEFLQRLMNCARTFYENRSRLDDHVLMTRSNWEAARLDGHVVPESIGAEMWRVLEKQEHKWSRAMKGFNSTVQLLATTDNPSALPLAMRLQTA
ncbi:unnamed protein product [Parajaminaea phylloscopi]